MRTFMMIVIVVILGLAVIGSWWLVWKAFTVWLPDARRYAAEARQQRRDGHKPEGD